jgi:hypothetical protein
LKSDDDLHGLVAGRQSLAIPPTRKWPPSTDTFETQLAGMATSDIAIYDTERNDTWLVPGASDPNQLEIYPYWTPDGKIDGLFFFPQSGRPAIPPTFFSTFIPYLWMQKTHRRLVPLRERLITDAVITTPTFLRMESGFHSANAMEAI